jgi:electron transfer flavoprotein alpha subunit
VMGRAATWEAAPAGGDATVTSFDAPTPKQRVRHRGYVQPAAGDVDITTAEFLLAIGRGVEEQANIAQFTELAETLGATLACSRPLVDAGWMPDARQVGQSGRTVSPKVYLAFGISGAVQHLAGMKSSGTIIAVNTDPEAAIFGVAHYGAVCDLFDVAEALQEAWA